MSEAHSGPIRIANCSGFYGDRLSAASEMVEGGPIDVLTGDWLAELTMLILARTRTRRPGGGYARTFVTQMQQVMSACVERNIKVVSNAGGLDPAGCAQAVASVAGRLGLEPRIAWVSGDDLMRRLDPQAADHVSLRHFGSGEPITATDRFITANAYLGAWGIVEALNRGADIVITGRVTDAAVVCGPAAWHHRWRRDQLDEMAGAVVAGHIIECGTQATGGNYSFFTELDGLSRTGFPWADVHADGTSVIGKHDGTGGAVTVGTVTAQLLYEIDSPAYAGPDVVARFDTIRLEVCGRDRVRVSSVQGEPPPRHLKVAANSSGGFRSTISVALTGLDVDAKAALVQEAFWRACRYQPGDYDRVVSQVIRTDKADPASNEEAAAVWRLDVFDADKSKLGRTLSAAVNELALATIPGMFSAGGSARPRGFGVYHPALVPAELVPQYVNFLDGDTTVVDPVYGNRCGSTGAADRSELTSDGDVGATPAAGPATAGEAAGDAGPDGRGSGTVEGQSFGGPSARVALGRLIGTRSGDKGGNANLGVFARSADAFEWIDAYLSVDRLRELLPETAHLRVDRYRLPNIWSLNFVVHGILGDGVAASARQDPQAKSLGEWLRAKIVDVPVALLDACGEPRVAVS